MGAPAFMSYLDGRDLILSRVSRLKLLGYFLTNETFVNFKVVDNFFV